MEDSSEMKQPSTELVNVDISNLIQENFVIQYETLSDIEKQESIPSNRYRTRFDIYWKNFYNNKAKNIDYDLLSLQFL